MTQFEDAVWKLAQRLQRDFAMTEADAVKRAVAIRFQYPTQHVDDELLRELVAERESTK